MLARKSRWSIRNSNFRLLFPVVLPVSRQVRKQWKLSSVESELAYSQRLLTSHNPNEKIQTGPKRDFSCLSKLFHNWVIVSPSHRLAETNCCQNQGLHFRATRNPLSWCGSTRYWRLYSVTGELFPLQLQYSPQYRLDIVYWVTFDLITSTETQMCVWYWQ